MKIITISNSNDDRLLNWSPATQNKIDWGVLIIDLLLMSILIFLALFCLGLYLE